VKEMKQRLINGHLSYRRTPIEKESPEEYGYEKIKYNLAESSVPDFILGDLDIDLNKLTLSYGDHRGNPILRQSIAEEGENISPNHILTTTGAAGALFIIATSLLSSKDHIVVLHPNYVANLETPRAIGCQIDYLRLSKENNFKLDLNHLEETIKTNTRLISLTYPQNPTGTILTESELYEIVGLVESKGIYLLLDETYREMTYNKTPLPMVASLSEKTISVSSFSKAYGLPGIRLGWLVSRDPELMETFLAAKELIFICNSLVDEAIGSKFVVDLKTKFLTDIIEHVLGNYMLLENYMNNSSYLEWVKPSGGCICLPWIKNDIKLSISKFYNVLKETYKTFVGFGHWFEVPDNFFRIGYGYPSKKELEAGLQCITDALEDSLL
jgi:aspartate/methionine/tyrosine aminotransferase